MSKFDEAVSKYQDAMDKLDYKYDADLLTKVAKGLGPSIYNADSSLVSCTDQTELDRVKQNFLIKKLGLADGPALDEALAATCEKYKSNRRHRAVFYYMLVEHFGKASIYG